jgi:hypothetical protein
VEDVFCGGKNDVDTDVYRVVDTVRNVPCSYALGELLKDFKTGIFKKMTIPGTR